MILVFGGGGQLGRELAGQAEAAGLALTALGHGEADIADAAAVARAIAAIRPSLVVNAAAYNAVDAAESEIAAAMRANGEGPGVLAEAAARHGVPLVHISSDYVFDGEKGSPYVEDDAIGPLSTYGRSKAAGEAAVRRATKQHFILRTAWLYSVHGSNFVKTMVKLAAERPELKAASDYVFDGEKGSPYVEDDRMAPLSAYGRSKAAGEDAVRRATGAHYILRTAWLYSVHGSNFVKTMVKLAAERPELKAASDQTSSPTSARDLADAILVLAARGGDRFGTYHLAGSGAATRHEWASAIVAAQAAFTGRNPPVDAVPASTFPAAARRPRATSLDCSKFAAVFGYRARDWQEAVEDTVAELFTKGEAA